MPIPLSIRKDKQLAAYKTLIANLKKAKFDRETITIAGGEFDPAEILDILLALEYRELKVGGSFFLK